MAIDSNNIINHTSQNIGVSLLSQIHGWWDAPNINNWGSYPDPQGNFPKPDVNFILPANSPIAAILPGTVSGVNQPPNKNLPFPAFGAVVTVKMDQPINQLATHYALLHLAHVSVSVGDKVKIGDTLGYGGGNQTEGSAPAAVGFAFYPGDYYGYGKEWTQYIQTPNHVADQRLNPTAFLNDISNGNIGSYLGGSGSSGFDLSSLFSSSNSNNNANKIPAQMFGPLFSPNETVQQALFGIDSTLALQNPIPPQGQYNMLQWPDWLGYFFQTLGYDAVAFLFRALLVLLGLYICFQSIQNAIKLKPSQIVSAFTKPINALDNTINQGPPGQTGP